MRKHLVIAAAILAVLTGCNQPDPDAPGSDAAQKPPVDTDPTPNTGTGGASQTTSPDGTTNGAPGTGQDTQKKRENYRDPAAASA